MTNKQHIINVRVDDELLKLINAKAKKEDRDRSSMIRILLKRQLEQ